MFYIKNAFMVKSG